MGCNTWYVSMTLVGTRNPLVLLWHLNTAVIFLWNLYYDNSCWTKNKLIIIWGNCRWSIALNRLMANYQSIVTLLFVGMAIRVPTAAIVRSLAFISMPAVMTHFHIWITNIMTLTTIWWRVTSLPVTVKVRKIFPRTPKVVVPEITILVGYISHLNQSNDKKSAMPAHFAVWSILFCPKVIRYIYKLFSLLAGCF